MTVPSDFESYCNGVVLRSANYSGGAGGTFTDLVTGNEDWAVVSATPSFSTQGGISGMDFANSATESVLHELRAIRECTIVVLGYPSVTTSVYLLGSTDTAASKFGILTNANRGSLFHSLGGSGYANCTASSPAVYAVTMDPVLGKYSCTCYDGTLTKASTTEASAVDYASAIPNDRQIGVGRGRTTYLTGWVSEVHIFSRALHRVDETALDQLITDLGATVGI